MIYTIASSKGGVGKSTTAINLAHHLGIYEIIELDLHESISSVIGMRRGALKKIKIHRCKTDLELAKLISNIKNDVIIDCGGYDNDLNSIAISAADIVIVPAKESALELNGLKKFNSILQRISKKSHRQITGFVFPCRNHHAKKKFPLIERTCELNSNLQLICSPVAQRAAIDDAAWLGCSLAEIDAQEPGAKEFEQLSKQLEVITNGKG